MNANNKLFIFDLSGGRILSANDDGSELKTLVSEGQHLPDGVVVDVNAREIYGTNMGNPSRNDGVIMRADLDGGKVTTIVPEGATFTPKQLQIDKQNGKLYWSDREGMRVMRANLDGSELETLIETGHGESDRRDAQNWCVGIALDIQAGKLDGSNKKALLFAQGNLSGIAYAEIPATI
jgi:sugar lactone lactonase YvrE